GLERRRVSRARRTATRTALGGAAQSVRAPRALGGRASGARAHPGGAHRPLGRAVVRAVGGGCASGGLARGPAAGAGSRLAFGARAPCTVASAFSLGRRLPGVARGW